MPTAFRAVARAALTLGTLWLGESQPAQAQEMDGDWRGAIDVLGQQLPFVVHFVTADGALTATMDIHGATSIPLQNVSYDPPKVHFELMGGPGLAVFDGEQTADTVRGSFTQRGIEGTFEMVRGGDADAEEEDAEPDWGVGEDVTFTNGDVTLAGTLSIPDGDGPFPAVVTITGSGPQNRDEQLFGDYRPFRVIADHFRERGIAVLRYDDRGVGGSSGNVNTSTSEDFARDVVAAVEFLKGRPEIDADRIGVLGHSEGGIVGPLAATMTDDIAFVIILAGPAYTGEQILYQQGALITRAEGGDEEDITLQRMVQEAIFHALRSGEGWDSVRTLVRRQVENAIEEMTDEQRAAITDREAFIEQRVEAGLQRVRTPWFRAFLDYDPVPVLEQLDVPVLALFGEHDLQVPPDPNAQAMREALAKSPSDDVTVEVVPGVNHLFLPTETGRPSEYQGMSKQFPDGFLERISEWVLERFARTHE